MEDKRVIQCNLKEANSRFVRHARAYVLGVPGSAERLWLLARSRSGRWIQVWVSIQDVRDLRLKTVPPEHPLYERLHEGYHAWLEFFKSKQVSSSESE